MSQTIPLTTKCDSCGHHYGSHVEPGQLQYVCYYSGGGGCVCAGFGSSVDAAAASSPSQTYAVGAVDYGYPKGVKVSGIPCPNCQALGPHMCPAYDGLRWAQQDELNSANRRGNYDLQQQILALKDTAYDQQKQIDALRIGLATTTACAHIGSDVPAAAAPSSPNIVDGGGWVSCADRLPDHKHPVLVYAPEYTVNVRIDICCGGNRRYWRSYGENVTHWMPLPPPPAATSAQPATTADRRNSDNDGGWISDIGG